MYGILKFYQRLLIKYPIGIQAVQTGLLMGSGDFLAQVIIDKKSINNVDFFRTWQFTFIGTFFVGPPLRLWYGVLDKFFGSQGKLAALRKVAMDQLLFAPPFLALIMTVVASAQGDSLVRIKQRLSEDYMDVLKSNYKLWPAVQLCNFYIVPLHFQVITVQIVAIFWNMYLSWKMNRTKKYI